MSQAAVTGCITDMAGRGIGDLNVVLFDEELFGKDVRMGACITNASGNFKISYSKWGIGHANEWYPDFRLRVFNAFGRMLFETKTHSGVNTDNYSFGIIKVEDIVRSGYKVTNNKIVEINSTSNTISNPMVSSGNRVTPLIDNEEGWSQLAQAIENATTSINSMQLYFDVGELYVRFTNSPLNVSDTDRLEKLLEARANSNVKVRILMNDFILMPYPIDTAGVTWFRFTGTKVETENFEVWVNTPMHAKATVIDGQTTIFNASPLLQEYYDDTNHHLRNQKRGKMSWKPFNWFPTKNAIRVPIHDVNVKIEGAASVDVETTFKLLWEHEGQEFTDSAQPTNIGNEHVQIVRTLPGNTFNNMYYGETGILQAYQRAFENAQSLIYIENQYLTNKRIAQSLFSALKRNATLELIVLMNNAVDIPGYFESQNKLVGDFIKNARSEGFGNRIGFFTRWTYEPDGQTFAVVRNYVHAKVGIVDDVWATIGSANLDGTSLDLSEHLLWVSRDDQYEERAVEMNAVFINGIEGFNRSTVPLNLRNSLFTEHLGMTSNQPPAGGWLRQWKNKADETLQNIKTRNPGSPRILEWNNMEDPVEYLKKAGVTSTELKQIRVYKEVPSFDFSKKEWV